MKSFFIFIKNKKMSSDEFSFTINSEDKEYNQIIDFLNDEKGGYKMYNIKNTDKREKSYNINNVKNSTLYNKDIEVTKKINYYELTVDDNIFYIFMNDTYFKHDIQNNMIQNTNLFNLLEDVEKEKKKNTFSGGVKYVKTEERCNKKIVYKNGRKKYVKENKEYISLSEYKKKKEKKEKK
jgi:hypothetical protein